MLMKYFVAVSDSTNSAAAVAQAAIQAAQAAKNYQKQVSYLEDCNVVRIK